MKKGGLAPGIPQFNIIYLGGGGAYPEGRLYGGTHQKRGLAPIHGSVPVVSGSNKSAVGYANLGEGGGAGTHTYCTVGRFWEYIFGP